MAYQKRRKGECLPEHRHERYAQARVAGYTQRDAAKWAGSRARNKDRLSEVGHQWESLPEVQERIRELMDEAKSIAIANRQERMAILTEIARGNLADYEQLGADGSWVTYGKESPNPRAVASVQARTTEDGAVISKVVLDDRMRAISELNKMDGEYAPTKVEGKLELSADDLMQIKQQLEGE